MNRTIKGVAAVSISACMSSVAPLPAADLERLRRAGLLNVNLGLESGCQDLLDVVKRGQTLDEFRHAVAKLRDLGIGVSINVIGGLGGTAFRDRHVAETVDFVRHLPPGVKVFYSRLDLPPESHYAVNCIGYIGTNRYSDAPSSRSKIAVWRAISSGPTGPPNFAICLRA